MLNKIIVLLSIRVLRSFLLFPVFSKSSFIRNALQLVEVKRLAYKGVLLGKNSVFYNVTLSSSSKGDHFIIGNNSTLTHCTLLGHDASPAIFLPELVNSEKPWLYNSRRSYRESIVIGDNVFVGFGAIVLPGTVIEDNVIVSAGCVVSGRLESGYVYGGVPGKKIKKIEEFKVKYRDIYNEFPERF